MVFESSFTQSQNQQEKPELQQKPFFSKADDNTLQNTSEAAFFQPKMSIGQPGDKYEQEADAVADAVVNQSTTQGGIQEQAEGGIQRMDTSAIEEDKMVQEKPEIQKQGPEEEMQMKPEIQMQNPEEEMQMKPEIQAQDEEEMQMKPAVQMQEDGGGVASQQLSDKISSKSGGGQALPDNTKAEMESSFGADLSNVNVHTDQESVQMNQELGAQAFTHGSDIFFNQGKYDPESSSGKHLLAHELTHTVQQNGVQQKAEK